MLTNLEINSQLYFLNNENSTKNDCLKFIEELLEEYYDIRYDTDNTIETLLYKIEGLKCDINDYECELSELNDTIEELKIENADLKN